MINRNHRLAKLILEGVNLPGEVGALVARRGYNVKVCHAALSRKIPQKSKENLLPLLPNAASLSYIVPCSGRAFPLGY